MNDKQFKGLVEHAFKASAQGLPAAVLTVEGGKIAKASAQFRHMLVAAEVIMAMPPSKESIKDDAAKLGRELARVAKQQNKKGTQ